MQKSTMTDWHTHILPAMDDGSTDAEESLAMLELSAKQGVGTIVLTPHFYPQEESPSRFLQRRAASLEILEAAIVDKMSETEVFLPERRLGAEVYYFPQLASMAKEDLKSLCIGSTNLLLIEMPLATWDDGIFKCLEALLYEKKIIPVLAHIDRYYKFIKDLARLDRLIKEGLRIQMNAGALTSIMTRRKALGWIAAGKVHLLGSDCHNMQERKPNLASAYEILKSKAGQAVAERLLT